PSDSAPDPIGAPTETTTDPDAATAPAVAPLTPVSSEPPHRRDGPFAMAMVLVAVLGGSALFMSGFAVGRDVGKAPGSSISDTAAWQPLWDVYNAVTTRYPLAKLDRTTLIEGAIRGMVEAIGDPYSTY